MDYGQIKRLEKIPPHKTPKWVKRYIPRCKAGVTEEEGINTLYVKGRHYVYKIVALFLQSVCEDISNWWSETDNYSTLMIPRVYYSKADEMVPDPQIHSIKTLYYTLMTVKLPRYNISSFRCSHASEYLEWYLEGAGFDTYIVESEELDHAWVIVELPEDGRVAIEATALCEDIYQP
ncbi:MAG: hypothetical protein ACXQTS_05640, partial [Candidatus Methanospirareceae archaeon]